MSDLAISLRLAPLRARGLWVVTLEADAAALAISWARDRLDATPAVAQLDAADAAPAIVVGWFRALPIAAQAEVVALWPHYRAGVRLRYDDFAAAYDDLWYPSADDVWVAAADRTWVLDLDHEERFTLRRTSTA